MKKLLLSCLLMTIVSTGFSQVAFTEPSPNYGCPNTTHDVTIGVKNTSPYNVPNGLSYTISVTIFNDGGTQFYTFSENRTAGIPIGDTAFVTLTDIPFQGAMTCSLSISLSSSFPPPSGTNYNTSGSYVVQAPPSAPTLSESPTGTVQAASTPADAAYTVAFYKDGSYPTPIATSDAGTYTPTASGTYTAKAFENNSAGGCASAAASNGVAITVVTSIKESQNINVSVFPNPMASSVTISTALSNSLNYILSDMNGTVVRSAEFTSVTNVNVEALKAGTYVLTVKDKNATLASYKLVK